jgi:hypothetical protein
MKHRHENSRLIHAGFWLGHSLLWACRGITLSLPYLSMACTRGNGTAGQPVSIVSNQSPLQ